VIVNIRFNLSIFDAVSGLSPMNANTKIGAIAFMSII